MRTVRTSPRPAFAARHWFWVVLVLLLTLTVSPAANIRSVESDFVVEGWQTDSGLPHNCVTALEQTQDGYLWLGTSNGLARFDGIRFTTYRSADHPGLRDNSIQCLYEDRAGQLWVGTDQGGLISFSQRKFTPALTSDGFSSHSILSIRESLSGELWVGTASGLNRSDAAKTYFQSELLSEEPVYAIGQLLQSPVLFATRKGLHQLRNQRAEPYLPQTPELQTNAFFCMYQDFRRRLWLGGPSGLFRIESSGQMDVLNSIELGSAVTALIRGTDGQVWFATSAGDLFLAAPSLGPIDAALVARFQSTVHALLQDNEGNLWVGTGSKGLYRVKSRRLRWVPFPEISGRTISCIFETPAREILLIAENNDWYKQQGTSFLALPRLTLPGGVVIQAACATTQGSFWFGTRSDGLFQLTDGGVRQLSERDGLSDSGITALCPSSRGLWIGTRNGGLNLLTDGVVKRFNTPWGFTGAYACVLEESAPGDLWIGTTGDGLFRLSATGFSRYAVSTNSNSAGSIGCLWADADGSVWIGTQEGLCRWKKEVLSKFPSPNRTEPEAILQLRFDAEGNVWAGSSSGIYRYRKDQLDAYADGQTKFLDVVPYGTEDGLPIPQCIPRVLSPAGSSARVVPLFACAKGLILGHENTLRLNTDPPPVILESVLLDNEPAATTGQIKVPAGTASLQFQFTALSLTAPGKTAFRYQLEGLDSDWSEVTATRFARYPRLSPGKYRFHVVARNNDGVWNETGASVDLLVQPFWWETYWFRIGVLALAAAAVFAFYRLHREREREIQRLRVKIAGDLHDDIGSSLWSITLLSRMLKQQGKLAAEEERDVVEINRIAVQTSNSIRDIIWLINPAFDSLQELVLRIKDSAAITLRGVSFDVDTDGADLSLKLPADIRQSLLFLLKEALTNAAKHAHPGRVQLKLEQSSEAWVFTVTDDGAGFNIHQTSSGSGLKNMRARAQKMGGQLEISSEPGVGTRLVLQVPRPSSRHVFRLLRF